MGEERKENEVDFLTVSAAEKTCLIGLAAWAAGWLLGVIVGLSLSAFFGL